MYHSILCLPCTTIIQDVSSLQNAATRLIRFWHPQLQTETQRLGALQRMQAGMKFRAPEMGKMGKMRNGQSFLGQWKIGIYDMLMFYN